MMMDLWPRTGMNGSVARVVSLSRIHAVETNPHPDPTAIELSACDLKHDFFHSSLKMIRTVERKFASGNFPVGPDTDRRSHEEPLELFDHVFNRTVALQKRQQLILKRVESHRSVDLLGTYS